MACDSTKKERRDEERLGSGMLEREGDRYMGKKQAG
jgi:hypothetical protein